MFSWVPPPDTWRCKLRNASCDTSCASSGERPSPTRYRSSGLRRSSNSFVASLELVEKADADEGNGRESPLMNQIAIALSNDRTSERGDFPASLENWGWGFGIR